MNQSEVRLDFQYSEAEYIAANRLHFFSSPNIFLRLVIFGLFLVGAAVVFSVILTESFVLLVSLLFVALFEGALFHNVLVTLPRKYFHGDAKFRDRYELTFSDEGIKVKTPQIDSKLAWSLYTKIIEGRDMYVLIYGNETRTMTPVPKRAFLNEDQEKRFRELIARHITDHSGLKQIPPSETEYKPKSLTPPDWR